MRKILVSTQMMIHEQSRFRDWLEGLGFEVDFLMNDQFLSERDCLNIEPIYDGWIAGDDQVTSKVIDHLKSKLKVISKWGTGIDSIDKEYAENNGVLIKNSPGAFSDAVGEMAVTYLLALTRGLVDTHLAVSADKWPKKQFRTLVGLNVGLIGMGAIGQGAAKRLKALGCNVSYSDPAIDTLEYERKDIDILFKDSEAIIITSNLNASTFHLVNKNLLSKCMNKPYIINVGRGPIIKEDDLEEFLQSGLVSGAALDVFEVEPIPFDSKLKEFKNVILGSHNANNTIDAVEYVHKNTIDQLINAF